MLKTVLRVGATVSFHESRNRNREVRCELPKVTQ